MSYTREERRSYRIQYVKSHREQIRQYHRRWYKKNKKREQARHKLYYDQNKVKELSRHAKYRNDIRTRVLKHYGNRCSCCGESRREFLCMDHIGGGGSQHRKIVGGGIYTWLIRHQYPTAFRILCANCNSSFGYYGYCPHQKEKKNEKD